LLTLGSWSLDEKRPVSTRRSLSIRRQSANLEKAAHSTSYFNLPQSSTEGTTPPPPYFSPSKEEYKDDDKRWIDLLERQNKELMEQITVLSSQANPSPARKPRPMSFHGGPPTTKEQPLNDLQAILSSNLLIQKQIATMQEELLRARRRCAELSEVEARKRGLELRCLGLERVVEELMSAIDLMKNHPPPPRATFDEPRSTAESELKGLAIHIEDTAPETGPTDVAGLRQNFESLVISVRRRVIPYRLRAVVLYILTRLREHNTVDQIIGAGIIMMGTLMWSSFLFVENGKQFVRKRIGKEAEPARRQ
jgi:hypothetical protein